MAFEQKENSMKRGNRFVILLNDEEVQVIDEWMVSHHVKSKGEAARQLMGSALKAEEAAHVSNN